MRYEKENAINNQKTLTFEEFETSIETQLLEIGFLPSVAREKAHSFTGLWIDEKTFTPPEEIIKIIMNRPMNQRMISDANLKKYKKKMDKLGIKYTMPRRKKD